MCPVGSVNCLLFWLNPHGLLVFTPWLTTLGKLAGWATGAASSSGSGHNEQAGLNGYLPHRVRAATFCLVIQSIHAGKWKWWLFISQIGMLKLVPLCLMSVALSSLGWLDSSGVFVPTKPLLESGLFAIYGLRPIPYADRLAVSAEGRVSISLGSLSIRIAH